MEFLTRAHWTEEPNQRELDNRQVAYEAACEGMVLLKNDGALPFTSKKVALYGPGAQHTIKGGTGLGLAICRTIATQLGGEAKLDLTHQGRGARFIFTHPV